MMNIFKLVLVVGFYASGVVSSRAQEIKPEDEEFANFLREVQPMPPSERAKRVREVLSFQDLALGGDVVAHTPVLGMLTPPTVLNGGDSGWDSGFESDSTLARLFPKNPYLPDRGLRVVMLLGLLLRDAPEDAFRWMAPRTISSVPTVRDVVKVLACMERQPGALLSKPISKELWTQFYNSANPCCRIIALEKFDSTPQTSEELLKLYRECLFQTFGYLQVRALESIYRSKDYRPEVRNLLQEFLASSPVENDGTNPAMPQHFHNPIDATKTILAEIENGPAQPPVPSPPAVEPADQIDFLSETEFPNYLRELRGLSLEERTKRLTRMSQMLTMTLGGSPVAHKAEPGRLSPPDVLIGGVHGWSPSTENDQLVARLFPTKERQRTVANRAIILWSLLLQESPSEALAWMAQRSGSTVPSVGDVVKLVASTNRQPGAPLTRHVSKELWTKLYQSSNPCYKILALEKFDSTAQTPEELLKLYRECLLKTFGYLQVRALEGIYRGKDYRPEVRDLLSEFLASAPVEDDGTLPPFPANFSNPVDGARWLLTEMEQGSAAGAQAPTLTPVASKPPVPKAPGAKEEPNATGVAAGGSKELASAQWNIKILIIWNIVVTAGVLVLLVLMLRRRKAG